MQAGAAAAGAATNNSALQSTAQGAAQAVAWQVTSERVEMQSTALRKQRGEPCIRSD